MLLIGQINLFEIHKIKITKENEENINIVEENITMSKFREDQEYDLSGK